MQRADLVVVGASFAGLACARTAASRGLRVVVLERKPEPGAFPRTTGIVVKEVVEEWDIPDRLTRTVSGVRLYSPSLHAIDLASPGYYFLPTDTPELLRWLAAQAEGAGAEIRCGTPYRGAARAAVGFRLEGCGVECRILVGADGSRSRVARDFSLGRNRAYLLGLEAEYEGVGGVDPERLHCFLDSRIAPGYLAWVVAGVGITQVGLACRWPARPDLAAFVRHAGRLFDFRDARVVARRGGFIPVGGAVRRIGRDGVLLAGDAAGCVSPLTAGGIHTALHYGRRTGLAVADHLLAGGPAPERVMEGELPRFLWKGMLRRALDLAPPNRLLDLALSSRPLRALASTIFFHHRGLLSGKAWRDLLERVTESGGS